MKILTEEGKSLFTANPTAHVAQVGEPNQFKFTEGPVWSAKQNCWYFSCIPGNTIYTYGSAEKGVSVYRQPSNHANGLFIDPLTHALIACEHKSRTVTTTDLATGVRKTIKGGSPPLPIHPPVEGLCTLAQHNTTMQRMHTINRVSWLPPPETHTCRHHRIRRTAADFAQRLHHQPEGRCTVVH